MTRHALAAIAGWTVIAGLVWSCVALALVTAAGGAR